MYHVFQGNQFTNSAVLSTLYQCNQCKLTVTYIQHCITNQFAFKLVEIKRESNH